MLSADAMDKLTDGRNLPVSIDLNTLNRCNVGCIMCPPAVYYAETNKLPKYYRLSLDEYKRITDGVRVEMAHFIGAYAEPLLNKELFSIIKYAKECGSRVAITTNGILMDKKVQEEILVNDVDTLTISLHGSTRRVAEAVMVGADFTKIIKNIVSFGEMKNKIGNNKPYTMINFVGMKQNITDLPGVIYLAKLGAVNQVNLVHLIDGAPELAAIVDENLIHHPELLKQVINDAREVAKSLFIDLRIDPAYLQAIE